MIRMRRPLGAYLLLILFLSGCASAVRKNEPDPWKQLMESYARIEAIRDAFGLESGSRREQIAGMMNVQRQLEPVWVPFMSSLESYYRASGDPRAAALWVREKILLGDHYADLLARYDRAIEVYISALTLDPENAAVLDRIARAQKRAFIEPGPFNSVVTGMREVEVVQRLGYPRVDWMRQVVRSGRVYQAWIYPRMDGGAAAVYFEDGRVYHKNWQAAPAAGGGGR